jgi:predicted nuclease of predicted toxin-antitoxin system
MKILLDEDVPVDILPVLRAAQQEAESVNFLGWKGLPNGELLARAQAGYDLFVTRDKDFEAEPLGRYVTPQFGIVLLAIRQQRGPDYAAVFAKLWPTDPSSLIGKVTQLGP